MPKKRPIPFSGSQADQIAWRRLVDEQRTRAQNVVDLDSIRTWARLGRKLLASTLDALPGPPDLEGCATEDDECAAAGAAMADVVGFMLHAAFARGAPVNPENLRAEIVATLARLEAIAAMLPTAADMSAPDVVDETLQLERHLHADEASIAMRMSTDALRKRRQRRRRQR